MRLWSKSFNDGGAIPAALAFGQIDPATHVGLAPNRNPHLAWDDVPAGTASLILFCYDVDAPTIGTDVNQEGHLVPETLPRTDFFHWTLADIAPALKVLEEGAFSHDVTAGGKDAASTTVTRADGSAHTMRQGLNDYTGWFAGDADMAGDYYGYDGPCPPWNDQRLHRYIFRLYALDVPQLDLDPRFTGAQARAALSGHILDEAQILGVYSLQPEVAATLIP